MLREGKICFIKFPKTSPVCEGIYLILKEH